ncbi:NMN amidohydrolase-like protein YfaY [Pigmentiphaga humi]|uniref:NMN amidohydrolase-like protein YfaY n=1 Tax=Pigmentiphaga humi TaxID=2478468 RepID=A0A3P4B8C5_9BURK|nr:molybdopterin-binding protein [Pigmentiphaga humi]VCU72191.1 NMN amidohydrolase-like protein YfaY [Pigmentiphaga humi]
MTSPDTGRNIGLFIIGDEILSGRRQDRHFSKIVELLGARGLRLAWAHFLGDEREALTQALRRSFASGDVVFCCGGIGATPDDHTRQAAAAALDVPLALHDDARVLITQRCQDTAAQGSGTADMSAPDNVRRLQMGEFPVGSEIVPNPYNKIPGFFIRDHTFVPGFPIMAWPMIEWTLDHRYAALHHAVPHIEHSFMVFELAESRIAPVMETLEHRWPGVKAFSLPSMGDGKRRHIELGVKGEPASAAEALAFLQDEVRRLGGEFGPPPTR